MADTGQTAHSGQGISVKVDGSNIQITLHGQGRGQNRAVGWGAVEDAVRTDDERQVQSCKEDIDSLLTFAGLYSAALTALLALSFAMLQEDTAGESLQVLRQIALQTATYQLLPGGGLNTTAAIPPPSSSPFEPSRAALRVNILWFASLVFSLSTASIGILVKQWLRAYTSYRTSSAQGRMRVRYFRHQGMEIWKVYEIAAVLPFLIQLALGLFFVGLCYFTAGVHPDLGHATLPLVAGWAMFIFVVTVLPIFSSYCPYKPALSEGLFSAIRPRLFALIAEVCVFMDRLTRRPFAFIKSTCFSTHALIQKTLTGGSTVVVELWRALLVAGTSSQVWIPLNRFATAITADTVKGLRGIKDLLLVATPKETELEEQFFGRLTLRARKHARASGDRPYDEADAVKYTGNDLDVLMFADALQSDDELLGTAITDALKQTQPILEHIAVFLLGVLRSRDIIELSMEDEPPTTLDCQSLTPRVITAIADIVVHHHHLIRHNSPSHACRWLSRILVSLPRPLPAGGLFLDTLTFCDEVKDAETFEVHHLLGKSSEPPDQSFRIVLSALKLSWISKYLPSHTMDSTRVALYRASWGVSDVLDNIFERAGLSDRTLSEDFIDRPLVHGMTFDDSTLQDTKEWLVGLIRQQEESVPEDNMAAPMRYTLSLIFRLYRLDSVLHNSRHVMVSWNVPASLMRDCSKYCIINSAEGLRWAIWCYAANPSNIIQINNLTLKQHVHYADEDTLQLLHKAVAKPSFSNAWTSIKSESSACARISYILIHILDDVPLCDMTASLAGLWRDIFQRITTMLLVPRESHELPEDSEYLVIYCLSCIIDRIDRGAQYWPCIGDKDEVKKQEWWNQFKPQNSPFSNQFVFLLSRLLSEKTRAYVAAYCWRLQMVEEMFPEDVLVDDEHDDKIDASELAASNGGGMKLAADTEGTDSGVQEHLREQIAGEQSGLQGWADKSTEIATLDAGEPQAMVSLTVEGNSTKTDVAGVVDNVRDDLLLDSPLGHAGDFAACTPEQAHSERSGLKPADDGEPDDTVTCDLAEVDGKLVTQGKVSDGEEQAVAKNLGGADKMLLASEAGDLNHPAASDLLLDHVGRSHESGMEQVRSGGDSHGVNRGESEFGENKQCCPKEIVDEIADVQASDGGPESQHVALLAGVENTGQAHE